MVRFFKWAVLPVVAGAALIFSAAPAQAQGISLGIYGPNGGFSYTNAPYVQPYPVYVAPRPVYIAPRPVYVAPRPYYGPYYGGYRGPYHGHGHHHHGHHGHHR